MSDLFSNEALFDDNSVIDNTEDTSSGEVITIPFSPSDISLSTPPMNLGDLIDRIKYGWINMGTEYQRGANLWSLTQQSRLIESVLLGLRLPAFYFEEVNKNDWKIIDGLQRCSTIKNYCVDGTLALCDLEFLGERFNGKYYNDLAFDTIRDIRMLPITVNLLNAGTPDRVKYILFKRLNTGGVSLTPQEIRNAMYQGRAMSVVREMAENELFLKATDPKMPTKRMQNLDFVSRFIAFYLQDYRDYTPDLDSFINKSMELLRDSLSDNQISKMKEDFSLAMNLAIEVYGNDAFRKRESEEDARRSLNRAYFEVISTVFARLSKQEYSEVINNKKLLVKNSIRLMNNKVYNRSFSGGTGRRDNVIRRFSSYENMLKSTIKGELIPTTYDYSIETN